MFRHDSNAEMIVLSTHLCKWDDDRLNREIINVISRWEQEA